VGHREAFHELGVQDIAEFDSVWWSTFCLWKEQKTEKWSGGFFPGQTCPVGCATLGFSQLPGSIKGCLKCPSLNFMCT
jgi:hypothetical protein